MGIQCLEFSPMKCEIAESTQNNPNLELKMWSECEDQSWIRCSGHAEENAEVKDNDEFTPNYVSK